jgi:UDP-2,3-diacylglucosamine hydrolase
VSERLLFISDLHLQETRPDITEALLRFLNEQTGQCQALYILGDLFEMWIGDDAWEPLAQRVAAALKAFADAGARVYLMHGNRDFLIGDQFAAACGAELLPDPSVIDSALGPLLISHGDALCTDDVDYQNFRRQVRDPAWQQAFLARGLSERRAFAEQARQQSRQATAGKDAGIMDVNQDAVHRCLATHQQCRLLHGHTHRPDFHEIALSEPIQGQTKAWRLVLGDWDRQAWFADLDNNGVELKRMPLTV